MFDFDLQISQAWQEAQHDLGIEVELPFVFLASNSKSLTALVLIKKFGNSHGTIIISINDDFKSFFQEAETAGYYCSALNPLSYSKYNREIFVETLNDWGWYGDEDRKPTWYSGTP
jgi:hypothetical protein